MSNPKKAAKAVFRNLAAWMFSIPCLVPLLLIPAALPADPGRERGFLQTAGRDGLPEGA